MTRLLLAAVLLLAGCTSQMVADATAGAEARCREAQRLYDERPSVEAGLLTFTACVR